MVPQAYRRADGDVGGLAAVSPDLSVVICTRDRPVLLRRAIDAIKAQTFPGVIETVVVFDRSEPDTSLEVADGTRPVVVVANDHTPGLPGGRNAGVDVATAPLVAFCDDDDIWYPEKAARQAELLATRPEVDVVVSGVRIEVDGRAVDRALERPEVTFEDLLESRLMEVNFCTAMVRKDAFLERIGPADEHIPGGYAEDYEWVLRAARVKPIAVVAEPMVIVEWHAQSFFASRWQVIADALEYLVARYPEFRSAPRGLARILGQRSFALAALGKRKDAWQEIKATLRESWREPRAYLAGIVNTGLVPPDPVVKTLQRMGRGI
jgi:glycosyltransferase involved in cell wall biosynthesis